MLDVRGGDTGFPVLLYRDPDSENRLMIRAFNEGGFAGVDIDFCDFVRWLENLSPGSVDGDKISAAIDAVEHRDRCSASD